MDKFLSAFNHLRTVFGILVWLLFTIASMAMAYAVLFVPFDNFWEHALIFICSVVLVLVGGWEGKKALRRGRGRERKIDHWFRGDADG